MGLLKCLEDLAIKDRKGPVALGATKIRVALRGSSLNLRDQGAATARMLTDDNQFPLAEGAGIVGSGFTKFTPGEKVVASVFLDWQNGLPKIGYSERTQKEGIDGFAREDVVLPATDLTDEPDSYTTRCSRRGGDHDRGADRMAVAGRRRQPKARA